MNNQTSHECEQKEAILKIFNRLDRISEDIADLKREQALTNQLIAGYNDSDKTCILSRLAKVEDAVASLNIIKAQFMAIGCFIGFVASFVIQIIK